jgi:hypothetical protein
MRLTARRRAPALSGVASTGALATTLNADRDIVHPLYQ